MTAGLQLGAPGVYRAPERVDRSFRPVRLDVAGFVGVAPRGPVDEPVLVQSWSDYQLRFGGFDDSNPGLLPYAVSVFFEQGGERAYVLRVSANPATGDARAHHELAVGAGGQAVRFAARDEGDWGNRLRLALELDAGQQFDADPAQPALPADELLLPGGVEVPAGSLLRARGAGLPAQGAFRWVERLGRREVGGTRRPVAVLDRPLPAGTPAVAVVTATLLVDDGDRPAPRRERLPGLGLHPGHPRFLAAAAAEESLLVAPVGDWTRRPVLPADPLLGTVESRRVAPGRDRYAEITGASFFDGPPGAPPNDDPYDERPHRGADRLARVAEVGLLTVPDLAWRWLVTEPAAEAPEAGPGATFAPCPPPPAPTVYRPPAARMVPLDARNPGELEQLLVRQQRLVALAERCGQFVVLLDVPPGLPVRAVARWRARFNSSYAAAYHPWLAVTRAAGGRSERRDVPPSSFAAGIVAARERRLGLPWGPANELASGAVVAVDPVSDADHDALHQLGINVYRAERDGFRLTAARTLSRDRRYRQLSVRRLMTMLRLTLDRQSQWVVFEPNTAGLRALLRHLLVALLRELYRGGAFAGRSEQEAFFVRSGPDLNPQASLDLGRLVVEVGVAPAEPLEFLVLRISRDGDGGVRVEEDGRG